MDTPRSTADAILGEARRLFESLSSRAVPAFSPPDLTGPARQLLDQFQLVPKGEVDRLRLQIGELETRIAELESRVAVLTESDR